MPIPAGIITIWSGAIGNIPAGWVLCNGGNGTPDLRGRFVYGAGGALTPGDTGGSANHNHTGTTDGHAHDLLAGEEIPDVYPAGFFDNTTESMTDTFTTGNAGNIPPYYVLAYIMKT